MGFGVFILSFVFIFVGLPPRASAGCDDLKYLVTGSYLNDKPGDRSSDQDFVDALYRRVRNKSASEVSQGISEALNSSEANDLGWKARRELMKVAAQQVNDPGVGLRSVKLIEDLVFGAYFDGRNTDSEVFELLPELESLIQLEILQSPLRFKKLLSHPEVYHSTSRGRRLAEVAVEVFDNLWNQGHLTESSLSDFSDSLNWYRYFVLSRESSALIFLRSEIEDRLVELESRIFSSVVKEGARGSEEDNVAVVSGRSVATIFQDIQGRLPLVSPDQTELQELADLNGEWIGYLRRSDKLKYLVSVVDRNLDRLAGRVYGPLNTASSLNLPSDFYRAVENLMAGLDRFDHFLNDLEKLSPEQREREIEDEKQLISATLENLAWTLNIVFRSRSSHHRFFAYKNYYRALNQIQRLDRLAGSAKNFRALRLRVFYFFSVDDRVGIMGLIKPDLDVDEFSKILDTFIQARSLSWEYYDFREDIYPPKGSVSTEAGAVAVLAKLNDAEVTEGGLAAAQFLESILKLNFDLWEESERGSNIHLEHIMNILAYVEGRNHRLTTKLNEPELSAGEAYTVLNRLARIRRIVETVEKTISRHRDLPREFRTRFSTIHADIFGRQRWKYHFFTDAETLAEIDGRLKSLKQLLASDNASAFEQIPVEELERVVMEKSPVQFEAGVRRLLARYSR